MSSTFHSTLLISFFYFRLLRPLYKPLSNHTLYNTSAHSPSTSFSRSFHSIRAPFFIHNCFPSFSPPLHLRNNNASHPRASGTTHIVLFNTRHHPPVSSTKLGMPSSPLVSGELYPWEALLIQALTTSWICWFASGRGYFPWLCRISFTNSNSNDDSLLQTATTIKTTIVGTTSQYLRSQKMVAGSKPCMSIRGFF